MEKDIETNKEKTENPQNEDEKPSDNDIEDAQKQFQNMMFHNQKMKKGEMVKEKYAFWDGQPVPSFHTEKSDKIGPIDDKNDLEALRKTPYNLPKNFEWHDVDINNKKELQAVRRVYFVVV